MSNLIANRRIINRAVDPLWGQVQLLLSADGAHGSTTFRDLSPRNQTVTANGNAQIVTDQSASGGGSALFDGTGDYLSVPSITLPGNFTAEFWIRWVTRKNFAAMFLGSSANTQLFVTLKNDQSGVRAGLTGIAQYVAGSFAWTNGVWTHVAVVRNNGEWKTYINGIDVTDGPSTNTTSFSGELRIGGDGATTFDSNAYIDSMRITGEARYLTNFSPPLRQFPNS